MLADRTDPEAPVDAAVLAQAERYHSSWRSGLSEWCGTTASPEDRAAVHRCLQDARVELDAMLERAREASSDASTVLMAMDRLPAVEMCVAADARAWPRPADPQLGAAVDRLRDAMLRARARHVLGQHTRARADLDALQTDAALAFDAARAELLLAVAETTVDGADPEAGPAQLREAIAAAMSAGHDAVVIRAWIAMARATIQTGTDPARGDEYLGYAEAALDRLGRPAGLVAAVALARGEAAQLQGRAPEARAALGEAVTGSSPGSSTRLDALHALANLEASVGAVEAAVAVHDELLTQRRARFGDPSMPVARSLLALGSAYGRLGRWQESADAAGRVAEIVEALLGTGHWWVALALHNRADALRHLGRVEEALAVQRRALAIAEVAVSAESPTMARIRRGEATIRRDAGDLAGATAALVEQCDAVERRLGVHLDVADCWVDLAATHLAGGRLDDGLVTITRAVSIYGATLGPDAEPLGRARSIAGQILRRRGDLDRAVTELSAAITILEQTDPDPGWLGHTLAELERARGADGQPSSREARQRAVTLLESADPLWAAQRASAQGLLAG